MYKGYRENINAICSLLFRDHLCQWLFKTKLAQLHFDFHFPHAGNAQNQLIIGILAQGQRVGRKARRFDIPPDKRMDV